VCHLCNWSFWSHTVNNFTTASSSSEVCRRNCEQDTLEAKTTFTSVDDKSFKWRRYFKPRRNTMYIFLCLSLVKKRPFPTEEALLRKKKLNLNRALRLKKSKKKHSKTTHIDEGSFCYTDFSTQFYNHIGKLLKIVIYCITPKFVFCSKD
jgi:hypothetical protein